MRSHRKILLAAACLCSLAATPASAQYGFNDGGFDAQGAGMTAGYCYFSSSNCPAGVWTGTHATGIIRSGEGAWGYVPANSASSYAFVQIEGHLTQTFTATSSGSFRFSWYEADRPGLGGQTYVVKLNGFPLGTYHPIGSAFVRQVSADFELVSGTVYTISFEGQSPGVDRSALIDSVKLSTASSTTSYNYDALGRLTTAAISGGAASGTTATYTYDSAGNRQRVTVSGVDNPQP
jgi:hypothetical protein